jgi:hypothetical protein
MRYRVIMQLEDHLGDIIRKARAISGITEAAAAAAAGISETELAALEESGKITAKINSSALGKLVGLDPQKFDAIAAGWLPSVKDLSVWRELRVFTTAGEGLTVNCYLVWDEVTRDAALFDTGLDAHATFSSPIRTGTTSNRCQKSAKPGPRRACIQVPGALRWTSATSRAKSFISAACASLTGKPPATRKTA